jgi:galactose mutarotase-like enzyme
MQTTLYNDQYSAVIRHKGAELSSLYNKSEKIEYIWNANPLFWPKSSPLLFPIVGQLRNNKYRYRGDEYELPRHGFARDLYFTLEQSSNDAALFLLGSSDETLARYPFHFQLRVRYTLQGSTLRVTYEVKNLSETEMFFSLGAHPAFAVPLLPGTSYSDYYLQFNCVEREPVWKVTADGLIGLQNRPLLDSDKLTLSKDLFYQDALVFKGLKSNQISLRTACHQHGIDFRFDDFPYFGIWAAPDADFVCLEPWCGIADSVSHDGDIEKKEGIIRINPADAWSRAWQVNCF